MTVPAFGHHPPIKAPKDTEKLIDGYTFLHGKARLNKNVRAGRDVWAHGRPKDGKISWNLMRSEYKRLLTEFRPGPVKEHARREREKARARAAARAAANYSPAGGVLAAIRACESGHHGYGANTGNGFYGAYQFTLSTWRSVGGSGMPHLASPAEQDKRAAILYAGGAGAGHWPNCP